MRLFLHPGTWFRRTRRGRRPWRRGFRAPRQRGQALLLVAVAFIGLAAFIGLLIDGGILFIAQAHLRRAVDAAALAASSQIRESQPFENIERFAEEFIRFNGVSPSTVIVRDCDHLPVSGDPDYGSLTALRNALCDTARGGQLPYPRKLIKITASVPVRFTFLTLINFPGTTVTADATSEAASIDAVVVIDASESMNSMNLPPLRPLGDPLADPTVCNDWRASADPDISDPNKSNGKCRPLWDAKQAAKRLLERLFVGYDQVAIVVFDYRPRLILPLTVNVGDDDGAADGDAYAALDNIQLHDDAPRPLAFDDGQYSPLNTNCNVSAPADPGCASPDEQFAVLSTCTGCGIRMAGMHLKQSGRPQALWVVVFLSDGATNVSDFPNDTYIEQPELRSGIDPVLYPNGYCGGALGAVTNNPLWGLPFCATGGFGGNPFIPNFAVRHCGPSHDGDITKCPPGAGVVLTTTSPDYNALDYARDQVDIAALTINCQNKNIGTENCLRDADDQYNELEPVRGANLAIYSIGLDLAAAPPDYTGEKMLRYMAAVGDDGDRVTDPCASIGPQANCGNYYYAPGAGALGQIFEDIASRIFTRLTQ